MSKSIAFLRVIVNQAVKQRLKTPIRQGLDIMREEEGIIVERIIAGAPGQNIAGSRLWPASSKKTHAVGVRLDWGTVSKDEEHPGVFWRSVDIQLDRDATNNTIRKAAADKGSHQKRLTILVRVDKDGQVVATREQLTVALQSEVFHEMRTFGL